MAVELEKLYVQLIPEYNIRLCTQSCFEKRISWNVMAFLKIILILLSASVVTLMIQIKAIVFWKIWSEISVIL